MDDEMLCGYNLDLNRQIDIFKDIIFSSKVISEVLERAACLNIKNYYISAGCIAQTVWNALFDKPANYGIKDIDFIYFDNKNLDSESENVISLKVNELFDDFNIDMDVKNEARVHLWYKNHFGYEIDSYSSLESAVNTFPTTATAIGIRKSAENDLKIYAPFGLNDLLGTIVRANKTQITKQIYENKVSRWLEKWPELKVVPWEK